MTNSHNKPYISYDDLITDNLRDPEYLQEYLTLCINDPDPGVFLIALRRVAKANKINFTHLATELDITRQGLYKSLSEEGNPPWSTLHALFKILGFEVSVKKRVI
ncbi:MAG: addiction module antidote protein [Candidatus Melainabacteria bacterium]